MNSQTSRNTLRQPTLKVLFALLVFLQLTQTTPAEEVIPTIEQTSALTASETEQPEQPEENTETTAEAFLIEQTNEYRAQYNLKPLKENEKLNEVCRKFAEVMARTSRMSHYADGRSPGSRVRSAGYVWSSVAENIAYRWDRESLTNEQYARATLNQWINSSGHRRNLLNSQNIECGAAFATNPQTGKTFAVMIYARPGN